MVRQRLRLQEQVAVRAASNWVAENPDADDGSSFRSVTSARDGVIGARQP